MPFPFAIAAAAAMAAAQAAAAKKRQDAQNEQDALTQASQQANSGYTKSHPVLAKLGAPTSWTDAAVGAAGTTWAQAQAFKDQQSREEMSKIYGDYMKSKTAQNLGGQAQSGMDPMDQAMDPKTGLPASWQLPPLDRGY